MALVSSVAKRFQHQHPRPRSMAWSWAEEAGKVRLDGEPRVERIDGGISGDVGGVDGERLTPDQPNCRPLLPSGGSAEAAASAHPAGAFFNRPDRFCDG